MILPQPIVTPRSRDSVLSSSSSRLWLNYVTLRFRFVDRATAKQFPSRHPPTSDRSSPSPTCKPAVSSRFHRQGQHHIVPSAFGTIPPIYDSWEVVTMPSTGQVLLLIAGLTAVPLPSQNVNPMHPEEIHAQKPTSPDDMRAGRESSAQEGCHGTF